MLDMLVGIRVIEFSTSVVSSACGKLLAESGAEVIVIEPLSGTYIRNTLDYYDFWQGHKKSIQLNIETADGMTALQKIIQSADVFLTDAGFKYLNMRNLDYESLKQIHPGLIYALATGWGEEGPQKDDPFYDINAFWAESGYMRDLAEAGTILNPPRFAGVCTMAQSLALATLCALFSHEENTPGCMVSSSLYANAIYGNHFQIYHAQLGKTYPLSRKSPVTALSNTYLCKDGWIVFHGYQFDRHFKKLLEVVGRSDLINNTKWMGVEDTKNGKGKRTDCNIR